MDCYRVLPSFTGISAVFGRFSSSLPSFYRVSLRMVRLMDGDGLANRVYRVLPSFRRRTSTDEADDGEKWRHVFTEFYRVLPSFTELSLSAKEEEGDDE